MSNAGSALAAGVAGLVLGVLATAGALGALHSGLGPHPRAGSTDEGGPIGQAAAQHQGTEGPPGESPAQTELRDYAQANEALARQVGDSTRRLQELDLERGTLQKQLDELKAQLRASQPDAAPAKSAFDLDKSDWAQLAKDGTVMYRTPCYVANGWTPSPSKLNELGLAPEDAAPIHDAYVASNRRLWSEIQPICAQVAGGDAVANKIGLNTCIHLVLDASRGADGAATDQAMQAVGEIRAGLREAPEPGQPTSPVLSMFLDLTGESARFQGDLARTFGSEEAHRLAFADGMCSADAEFGGSGPR